jgi:hypothetical protein
MQAFFDSFSRLLESRSGRFPLRPLQRRFYLDNLISVIAPLFTSSTVRLFIYDLRAFENRRVAEVYRHLYCFFPTDLLPGELFAMLILYLP